MTSKILFLLLYFNPVAQVNFSHFEANGFCYLDATEKQQLESVASDFLTNTGIDIIYVCRKQEVDDWSRYKGRLVIFLSENLNEREIKSTQRVLFLKQDYLDRLSLQFLQQSSRGSELVKSISYLCNDIVNFQLSQELLKQKYQEENAEEMSPEFWVVIKIYGILLLMYGVWVVLKWKNKATNKAEYWEHYGYSRFPTFLRYTLWVVVFSGYFLFLYNFVFFYSEIFILLIPLGFLMRPSVMLVSALISAVIDWRSDIAALQEKGLKVSLGQKRFMLNPKSNTEDLILLDLLELIIAGSIQITYQLKDSRYGSNLHYKFLSVNSNELKEGISSFQQKMISHLSQGSNYYVLDKLMRDLISEIGSFKAIRKDYILKDLVGLNYLSKGSWATNRFKLTPEGKDYARKLSPAASKMNTILKQVLEGSDEVKKIKKEVLLSYGYEKKIERLYSYLVENGRYEERMGTEISPLLEQTFSFYEFRSAIQHQINKIHQSYMVDEESQKGDY